MAAIRTSNSGKAMLKITALKELLHRGIDRRTPKTISFLVTLVISPLESRVKLLHQMVKRCLLGAAGTVKAAYRLVVLAPHRSHLLAGGSLTFIARGRQGAKITAIHKLL
jgi:hypothetical protein